MLRGIRKASANWLGKTVMATVMGLLIVSFAIWGIGDIFRGFGASKLAKIGRTEIGIEQFRQIYNDRLQQLGRQIGRPISPDQARALGFDQQLLGQLIAETVLDERTRQLGLGLSDAEVAKRITEDPTFRGFTGQFDRSRFEQMIRSAGYNEGRYVAEQRRVSLRKQLADTVSGDIAPPKAMADLMNRYSGEERSIEYIVLDRSKAGEIAPPTPEALAQYFEGRKASFRAPEYRKVVIIALSVADALPWVSVSDAELRAKYEEQRSRFVTPERRQLQQIVFPNADEARAASERLAAGSVTFAALAAERGLKDSDIDLGLMAKSAMVDRAVADAAFATPEGQVSAPVEGRFGATIIHVVKIEPEVTRSFEEVASELKGQIATERARAEVQERFNKVEDERAGGAQLLEAAQKLGLTAHTIEAVDRSGRDPQGNPVALPTGVNILSNIFSSDVGVENDPVQLPGGGYFWYDVTGVTPSRERPLEEVKDKVEASWRDDQIAERLKNKAKELEDKLAAGASMADVAASEGLKVETASGLKRGKSSEAISANLLEETFKAVKGAPGVAEGQNETERIVFRVTDIQVPTLDATSAEAKRIGDDLKRSLGDDILGQYIQRLQNDVGVSVNQSALRQVIGGGDQN